MSASNLSPRDPSAPLPRSLLRGSHTRADLASNGVHTAQLRGPLWTPAQHGLWTWSPGLHPVLDRILRTAPLIREGGAIGGWAAAFMQGHKDLDGHVFGAPPRRNELGRFNNDEDADADWYDAALREVDEQLPVLLCLPRRSRCRRARGVQVFRSDLEPEDVVQLHGVTVTSPVRTCADLARLTRPWTEAVVAVDVMARTSPELIEAAAQWIRAHPRWSGVRQARRVLATARPGVKSPQETRLRLLWTLDAGLPEPLVNRELHHVDGYLLGEADLLDEAAAFVGEFDGRSHSSARQQSHGHARREQMQESGLIVVQFTKVDLRDKRRATLHTLKRGHARGLARDRSKDLWILKPE